MSIMIKIWIGYILDILFGDPYWFPHPVRFIGKYINFLERKLYDKNDKILYGTIMGIVVVISVGIVSYILADISKYLEIFLLYTTLATNSLGKEGRKVYKILKKGDLELAKKELSYLVSRDTENMDEIQIVRSTVETIAENSVDGIIAPLFYIFLGSCFEIKGISLALPFAMMYKAINTLDSMVGYKNKRYKEFGKFSARLDDVVNFLPARVGGLIILPITTTILGYSYKKVMKIFFRDRKKHSSPNSGHPEAIYAGALGIQFGGKTIYFGKVYNKEKIGDKLKEFDKEDIRKALKIMYISSIVTMIIFSLLFGGF